MFKGRLGSFALGSAVFGACALSAVAAEAPQRSALILSEAAYPDADRPLKTPVADGKVLAETLGRHGFAVQSGVDMGGTALAEAVQRFLDTIRPGSIAVVYFSGFGIQAAGGNYLIPVDARIWSDSDVLRAGLSVDRLMKSMADRGAKGGAVILDASRRNPFERRFRSVSAGLAAMKAQPGTLSLASAAPGALVDADADEGMFAAQLVKALNTSGIDAEQAFMLCRKDVAARTHDQQVPSVVSGLDVPFSFDPDDAAKVPPTAVPEAARPPAAQASTAPAPIIASAGTSEAVPKPVSAPVPAAAPPADIAAPAASVRPVAQPTPEPPPVAASAAVPPPAPAAQVAALPQGGTTSTTAAQAPTAEIPMSQAEKDRQVELDRRIGRDPHDEDALFERGRLLALHGDYRLALLDLDRAISLNPNDADAFNDRCWTRSMADQLQTAMDDCDRALKLRPNFADAHDSRGLVLMKRGSAEAALVDYDAAIRLDAKQSSALYGRGVAELRLGRRDASEKDISKALALDPGIEAQYARYNLK